MDHLLSLQQLAVSFGLGLLLGLERERSERTIAGIRTFPFISLFGTVCAQVGMATTFWVIAAGLMAVTVIVTFANYTLLKSAKPGEKESDAGTTTEFAALLLYALGALIVVGNMEAVIVVGGVMVVLLHFKDPMHRLASAVGEKDMRAIMQFVLISMIILPALPNKNYGPYEVWNPFKIWLMVVFIVGISLCGYVAYKMFGARAGVILGGVIGGVISSTATTVSFARRCATEKSLAPLGAVVIMIASCIAFIRVLIEIAAVAPGKFINIAPPIGLMLLWCVIITAGLYMMSRKDEAEISEQKNPADFKSALVFAALYALVLLGIAWGNEKFGSAGLYIISIISGLTDMDAITLSTAGMAASGGVETRTAWHAILIASMSNIVFKFGTVAALGSAELTKRVAVGFGLAMVGGGLILWLWPW